MMTIQRFLRLVEDEGFEIETRAVGDGCRTRVGDAVLYYGDDGFRFAIREGRRITSLERVVEGLGFSERGLLTEAVATTTANVAAYQVPLGTRVDDFINRYGDEGDDDGPAHLMKRKF